MDCTFKNKDGIFNFRVGAIIEDSGKILMVRVPGQAHYYSVGGRVRLNETIEDAVIREVFEETGVKIGSEDMSLAYIHENFFTVENSRYHEISIYFRVKTNEEMLKIENGQLTFDGPDGEYLKWVDVKNEREYIVYPEFYKTMPSESGTVEHIVTMDI